MRRVPNRNEKGDVSARAEPFVERLSGPQIDVPRTSANRNPSGCSSAMNPDRAMSRPMAERRR